MWNVPHWAEVAMYAMIPLVLAVFVAGLVWRVRKWFIGQAEPGSAGALGQLRAALRPQRLIELVKTALFQARLAPDGYALTMHLAIFWGMAVLFAGTALATIDQDFTNLLFDWQLLSGGVYRLFELALDAFGVALLLGLGLAAYRRYVQRPKRLEPARRKVSPWDAFPFLTCLLLIAVTGFVIEGLRIAEGRKIEAQVAAAGNADAKARLIADLGLRERIRAGSERQDVQLGQIADGQPVFPAAAWAPVGYGLARAFAPLPVEAVRLVHQLMWWTHALLAFGLIVCVPFTKAFHLISSPANMLLREPAPAGRLPVVAESGVDTVRDLTWQQLLQVEACTWCGKCQEACPGHSTGQPLSPRDVVQAIDGQLLRTRAKANGQTPSLHGAAVTAEQLWACCACRACEEVCPVCVQQPRLIVDLRRRLVDQGQVDEGLQDALMNFQRYGNSFGQSARKRPEWAKPLEFKLKDARKEEVEYLWFVGDYAAYDQRAQVVTRTIARVLHFAGVDIGLLFEKEQNAGNDVRRIGEEGLFSMLREKNEKELAAAKFRKLLTTDPHTYNTLKNEYAPADGQPVPVLHYAELLDQLIGDGKLVPARQLQGVVTYHDPCYLGRFNGVFAAPRRVLAALGLRLVEMPRHGRHSFCCGAGGGRIWMKDAPGIAERPAENRVKEALALPGVQSLVVACPKDLAMFQDAVKTVGAEGRLRVVDLGELVYEALGISTQVGEPTA
jgi:Fe-S oxidoreductase/nitrate reductase gamma subunit